MLLPAVFFQRGVRRALPWFVMMLAGACVAAPASNDAIAGTLPEDYLPPLKQILATAVRQSPQLILREVDVEQKDAEIYRASSQMLPHLSGDLHYDENQTSISSNTDERSRANGFFYSLGADQPLFHWGELKNTMAKARLADAMAEISYKEAYRQFATDLRRAYLLLVWNKMRLKGERAAIALQKRRLDATRERNANGEVSGVTVAGATLEYDRAKLELDRLEAAFAADRRHFAHIAGIGSISEEDIPSDLPAPLYKPEVAATLVTAVLSAGGKSTFEAKVAELQIKSAELSDKIAKVRLLPKFNVGGSYSLQNSVNATPNSVTQTATAQESVGISAHWNIFDGFATKGVRLEAKVEKRLAEAKLRVVTDAALEETQRLERALPLDVETMRLAQIRRDTGELGVTRAREEIGRGDAAPVLLEDNTINLYRAEADNALARLSFLADWSALVSLAGNDPVLNNLPSRYGREKR
jgi:outer membrane protein TolC